MHGILQSANRSGPVIVAAQEIAYTFPFGIAYIAGALRQAGEDVQIVFFPSDPSRFPAFAAEIAARRPLLVGFGGLYPDLYRVREMIADMNDHGREFPIVIGGQMVSPTPEFSVQVTGSDYGVIGEGEITITRLVSALREGRSASEIRGLAIRDGDCVSVTGPGEYIKDLTNLPPIPYDLLPTEKWLNIGRFYASLPQPHWRFNDRVVAIHGGRGCPYRCNFCYHHSHARYRPISDMLTEAEALVRQYDANMLYFGDDLVLGSPARARQLTEGLKQLKLPIEYSVSCRFNILSKMDDALLGEMKRTGCRIMGLGIESGSQRILDVMNKKITVEQIVSGLTRLKKAEILPTVTIMVGQYTETLEDVLASRELMIESVRANKNIQYAFTIATPFPGSELYRLALEKGCLKDDYDFYRRFDPGMQWAKAAVNLSEMTDAEVESWRSRLERLFNEEKRRLVGRRVWALEWTRKRLKTGDDRVRARLDGRLGRVSAFRKAMELYEPLYCRAQTYLDRARLRLLGIRT